MSIQTATNRLILPPPVKSTGFYQHLFKDVLNSDQLGRKLIMLSEKARVFRRFDELSEFGLLLSNFPSRTYQLIGQYYLSLSLCRNGRGELDKARTILEQVACNAPLGYRAQAMISLSAISWDMDQPDDTLKYCLEASSISNFNVTTMQSLKAIAALKGREGFHRSALKDLENLYSLMRYAPSHIYFDYLNSLAVELGEAGRKYEARNIIQAVVASPLAFAYPEWRETADELKCADRSFAVIDPSPQLPGNVLTLRVTKREGEGIPAWAGRLAPVVNYEKWKKRMAKKKNGGKRMEEMDEREMFLEIMGIYTSDETTDAERRQIYAAVIKVISKPKPDDDDDDKPGA
jgi:tetratricopeptide (TPR) repeat protein